MIMPDDKAAKRSAHAIPRIPHSDISNSQFILHVANHLKLAFLSCVRDPEHEINDNSQQQYDSQHSRPKTIIEASLAPQPDTLCPPMIRVKGVNHSRHGDDGEQEGGDESGPVAKVKHADCESPENDGEVEP
jgi:hypothetical protein